MGNKKIKFLSSYILWFSISVVSSSLLISSCLSNNKQDIKNISESNQTTFTYTFGDVSAECYVEVYPSPWLHGKVVVSCDSDTGGRLVVPEFVTYQSSIYDVDSISCHTGNLSEVNLANASKLTSIYGFSNMSALTKVVFPKKSELKELESIFNNCPNVTGELEIPESVEEIKRNIFDKSSLLPADSSGVVYSKAGSGLRKWCLGVKGNKKPEANYVIQDNTYGIASNAFDGCTELSGDLYIPSSVQYIGRSAFDNTSYTLKDNFLYSKNGEGYNKWFIGQVNDSTTFSESSLDIENGTYGIASYPLTSYSYWTQTQYNLPEDLKVICNINGPITDTFTIPKNVEYVYGSIPTSNEVKIKTKLLKSISSYMYELVQMTDKDIVIPKSITSISSYGLCSSARAHSNSIKLNEGLEHINFMAFWDRMWTEPLVFPSTLKQLDQAFNNHVNDSYYFLPLNAPLINQDSLPSLTSTGICYVPYSEDHSIKEKYVERFGYFTDRTHYTEDQISDNMPVCSVDYDLDEDTYCPNTTKRIDLTFNGNHLENIAPDLRPKLDDIEFEYDDQYINVERISDSQFSYLVHFLRSSADETNFTVKVKSKNAPNVKTTKTFDLKEKVIDSIELKNINSLDVNGYLNQKLKPTTDLRLHVFDNYGDQILTGLSFNLIGSLPEGLSFNKVTGQITGIPKKIETVKNLKIQITYNDSIVITTNPFSIKISYPNLTWWWILVIVGSLLFIFILFWIIKTIIRKSKERKIKNSYRKPKAPTKDTTEGKWARNREKDYYKRKF